MALRVVYSSQASCDISNHLEYIKRDSPARARNTAVAIEQTVQLLSRMPGLGRPHPQLEPNERQRFVSKYPYRVVFTVEAEILQIIAIIHTSRE